MYIYIYIYVDIYIYMYTHIHIYVCNYVRHIGLKAAAWALEVCETISFWAAFRCFWATLLRTFGVQDVPV